MEKQYVDEYGIPLRITFSRVKDRGDLIYQTAPRKLKYYRFQMDQLLLDLDYRSMSDRDFRIFCYIGKQIVYNNISYVNGRELMSFLNIDRRMYYDSIKRLKERGYIREITECWVTEKDEESGDEKPKKFRPTDKSDRIFLVSPAYFWWGGPTRQSEILKWYKDG